MAFGAAGLLTDMADRQSASASFATPGSPIRSAASAVTVLGTTPVALVLAGLVGMWVWPHAKSVVIGLVCPAAVSAATVVGQRLKRLVARSRRPTAVLAPEGGFSCPSRHTTAASALAVASGLLLAGLSSRPGFALAVLGVYLFGVGVSRLILGVHYRRDVLGVVALGGAVAIAAAWAACRVGRRLAGP